MANAKGLSLRGCFAPVAISGRHFQVVQGNDKTYRPIASVAAFPAQPLAALPPYGCGVPLAGCEGPVGANSWYTVSLKWQTPPNCHSEERSDVGISQYPFGSQGNLRRKRNCLHEIAPQGHFLALRAQGATAPLGPRNDKPLAFTVLSAACTGRQYRAGSGMPLPYNGRCMHRERPQICGLYTVRRGRRTLQHAIDTSTIPPKNAVSLF